MGLSYFEATCPSQSPTSQAAQIWCIAREGACCGICGNTRVGLSVTVFFATAVTVIDGAESPFNFAVAYLVVLLLKGFGEDHISRFHAYYALVAALGFICPLAASSVTATHFNYGGAHVETGKKLKRYGLDFSCGAQAPKIVPNRSGDR
ncbi:hypothetical protein JCM8202v2_004953 [Rhodotorula sphaerocarpa]